MKKILLIIAVINIQYAYCQTLDTNYYRIEYSIDDITFDILSDTTPAKIPEDYAKFCDCMNGLYTLVEDYRYEDIYRTPFTYKIPARFLLCSIVSLDSVNRFEKNAKLYRQHMTVISHGIYYTPYVLDYWIPYRIKVEDGLTEIKELYDYTLRKIIDVEGKKTEQINLNILIYPEEIAALRKGMTDRQTNLFLLRISDDGNYDTAFQFFLPREYNLSSLYSQLQYYKYIANRCKEYMELDK